MMKSLPVTALLAFLISGVMTSGTIHEDFGQHNRMVIDRDDQDSVKLMNRISVDSFFLPLVAPASGVQFYKNGIIFLADTRNESRMLPSHVSFGTNQSYFTVPRDLTSGEHILFSASEPFAYPSEAISFSSDLKTMYFTKLAGKPLKEKIFMARINSGIDNQPGWDIEKEPLEFCDENFAYSHPALSSDDKILIFASNQQGTLGGMDLFITRKVAGKWSVPQNPGKIINTSGNEFYPFLDKENNLYFSSDKLSGHGGYDIFVCRFNGYDWDKPRNLSGKINSELDDVAFTISRENGKMGFFTRRNPGRRNEMQLFRILLTPLSEATEFQLYATPDSSTQRSEELLTISSAFISRPQTRLLADTEKPKTPEAKAERKVVLTQNVNQPATEAAVKKNITPAVTPKTTIQGPTDQITYRVQFMASMKHKEKFRVTVDGKVYETYEYVYQGAFRYCIGEFSSLAPARDLQNAARLAGHNQAFVAAFRNNVRSLETSLFR